MTMDECIEILQDSILYWTMAGNVKEVERIQKALDNHFRLESEAKR